METDSFFWQLLKQLPETLFALLGLPTAQAADYRFDSVEIKKSYRLDGLFVPTKANLPVYLVEVHFRRDRRFYANLFAKVFSYLEKNDPNQDWVAVALFANRAIEPKGQAAYEDLLASRRVQRIYLSELHVPAGAAPGLALLQLLTVPESGALKLVAEFLKRPRRETDCEEPDVTVELLEELLVRKFAKLTREEIIKMFRLADIRKTRVWQEAHEEGVEEGIEKGIEKGGLLKQQEFVRRLISKGKKPLEIAELLEIPIAEVRRLAKRRDA
jgi:predicted transposase/invertase (TIGR01784 family)